MILILPLSSYNYKRHDSHLSHVILQLQKTWFSSYPCYLTVTKELILILPLSSWNYERHDSHLTLVILQLQKTWFTSYPCHLVITKDMIHILQMSSILQLKLSLFSSYIHYGHLIIKTAMIHNNDSDNNNSHDSHCIHVHLLITIFMILILPNTHVHLKITTAMILILHMSSLLLQQPWFTNYTCQSENYDRHDSHLTHVHLTIYYNSHDSHRTHIHLTSTTAMVHIFLTYVHFTIHDSHLTHVHLTV